MMGTMGIRNAGLQTVVRHPSTSTTTPSKCFLSACKLQGAGYNNSSRMHPFFCNLQARSPISMHRVLQQAQRPNNSSCAAAIRRLSMAI